MTLQIFVSYSHEDKRWFDQNPLIPRLEKFLRWEDVRIWYDKARLIAGDRWHEEIEKAIDKSQIAILLVSPDFIASDYIRNVELPLIKKRYDAREILVFPILVGRCRWDSIDIISGPQMLPGGPTPLISKIKDDDAWDESIDEITESLRKQIEKIRHSSVASPEPTDTESQQTKETATVRPTPQTGLAAMPAESPSDPALASPIASVAEGVGEETDSSCAEPTEHPPADSSIDSTAGFAVQRAVTRPAGEVITKSIHMKLTLIPAGEFLMGSPDSEQGGDNEKPQHRVTITRPFYLGVYPVTQEEYEEVMGSNPSSGEWWARRPVTDVSWEDANEFCRRLSEKEDCEYRLPTEAEWEYACRAGSTTLWCFGDADSELKDYAYYNDYPNNLVCTKTVGNYKPNAWGLHDMHGLVSEWCKDWYGADYYGTVFPECRDPQGPTKRRGKEGRVTRGGHWGSNDARQCRSAQRSWGNPDGRSALPRLSTCPNRV